MKKCLLAILVIPYTVFEIILKIIIGIIVVPALGLNALCVKLFNAKSYRAALLSLLMMSTFISVKLCGPMAEDIMDFYMQNKYGWSYRETVEDAISEIKEAFRG